MIGFTSLEAISAVAYFAAAATAVLDDADPIGWILYKKKEEMMEEEEEVERVFSRCPATRHTSVNYYYHRRLPQTLKPLSLSSLKRLSDHLTLKIY
eukprot:scaffold36060_cov68-Cyclotella_meneghiniana.AAC.4